MLTRRRMLELAGAALCMPSVAGIGARRVAAQSAASAVAGPPVRLGILQFGTAAWELAAMAALGLNATNGLAIASQRFATNDAGRIAFQAQAVDAIVTDLLWAARARAEGRDLVYLPFSSAEGAVMVASGAPIHSIADLAGKRLGVAGGALDKSWLMLRARAKDGYGLDLTTAARPVFAAPPLLAAQLERGDLDAALIYWTYCARLEVKGFRPLVRVEELVRGFGLKHEPTLVGYVFDGGFARANSATLDAFAAASRATKLALSGSGPEADRGWAAVRPLMQAEDDATAATLKRGFLSGIPRLPLAEDRAAAQQLYGVLARLGGTALVGSATSLPADIYWGGGSGR